MTAVCMTIHLLSSHCVQHICTKQYFFSLNPHTSYFLYDFVSIAILQMTNLKLES